MGYKRNITIETDEATCNFVRLIMKEVRTLDHEAANRRGQEDGGFAERTAAEVSRRFVGRTVEAASEAVREQLRKEGTWT